MTAPLSAIRQYLNQRIALIRNQTDRNILKVKNTILKKLRKKLFVSLYERHKKNLPLNQREKEFFVKYTPVFDNRKKVKLSDTDKDKETFKSND